MCKIEILKAKVVYFLEENVFLRSEIIKNLNQKLFDIKISNSETSRCFYDPYNNLYNIELGIKNIGDLYEFCKNYFCNYFKEKMHLCTSCIPLTCDKQQNGLTLSVSVDDKVQPLPAAVLSSTCFLGDVNRKIYDDLTLYAFAYSLYHEIGHIVHDKEYASQIEKEDAADNFAFEVVNRLDMEHQDDIISIRHLGLFLGITFILDSRNPQKENDDVEHSHSIKRISSLLEYWHLDENSIYWHVAYDIVCKWCKKNNLSTKWGNTTSISNKDKFCDAYSFIMKQKEDHATPTT